MVAETLEVGNGGWVRYVDRWGPVFLRFELADDRLRVVETYFPPAEGESMSARLQRLPLSRVEAWANQARELIEPGLAVAGPDLERAAAYFATTFGRRARADWVRDMLWSQIPASGIPQPPMPSRVADLTVASPDGEDLLLEIPERRPFGDAFYRSVAEVYRRAAALHRGPAAVLAEANGVPVSSVHSWVKEARRRGFLPAGIRGRAG
ncbi:MAG: hypothetical protein AB7G23_20065 [Vicinamibacterales bacterium]